MWSHNLKKPPLRLLHIPFKNLLWWLFVEQGSSEVLPFECFNLAKLRAEFHSFMAVHFTVKHSSWLKLLRKITKTWLCANSVNFLTGFSRKLFK